MDALNHPRDLTGPITRPYLFPPVDSKSMSVLLRDFFAAHVAAALVSRGTTAVDAAKQAYDVAEALMEEREHRAELAWLAEPPADTSEATPDSEGSIPSRGTR